MITVVRYIIIVFILWVASLFHAFAQQPLIQVSGIIMSSDTSHSEIPFATVYNSTMKLGSYANTDGFYSTVGRAGDTIIISCLGYINNIFVIPADYTSEAFIRQIFMAPKAYLLTETTIYPWGTRDQFRQAFLYMDIPDDDLTRSRKNLSGYNMQLAAAGLPRDGGEVSNIFMKQYQNSYYSKGQVPQNNLLNPLAWAQFFNDLSQGKYKIQH